MGLLLCGALLSFSCGRRPGINLRQEDSLALSPQVEWAVLREAYAAFRSGAGYDNPVCGHGRQGEVMMVTGKALVRTVTVTEDGASGEKETETVRMETWYLMDKGWLSESGLIIFDNKLKAQTAAQKLR